MPFFYDCYKEDNDSSEEDEDEDEDQPKEKRKNKNKGGPNHGLEFIIAREKEAILNASK